MDVSILILLAAICVAIAVLIGFLLGSIFSGKSSEPPAEAKEQGLQHSITFYTDRQVRGLIVQIDGKTVESPHLLNETQRRQLLLLDQALRKWLNLEATPQAKPSQTTPMQESSETNPAQPVEVPEKLSRQEASLLPEPPKAIATPSADAPPAKRGITDWLAQALQPKTTVSQPPKSIAMQVDEILQRKLEERGWQQRGIRLLELPNKGMVVMVGLEQYASVEDVPDAEIQAILRASVSEWEAKMYGS
ncbi:MAG: hypothetical protein DDG59_07190 [Anaerolineae bacterium]|jgi:hypothetical protein|nr:MAG: hypothetical protein DDG59_07190 [Anaerolineae bacterium]